MSAYLSRDTDRDDQLLFCRLNQSIRLFDGYYTLCIDVSYGFRRSVIRATWYASRHHHPGAALAVRAHCLLFNRIALDFVQQLVNLVDPYRIQRGRKYGRRPCYSLTTLTAYHSTYLENEHWTLASYQYEQYFLLVLFYRHFIAILKLNDSLEDIPKTNLLIIHHIHNWNRIAPLWMSMFMLLLVFSKGFNYM